MNGVFDPFGDPVTGEGDEDEQADYLGCRAAASTA